LTAASVVLTPRFVATRFRMKRLHASDSTVVFDSCPACTAKPFDVISSLVTRSGVPVIERAFCARCGHAAFSRMPTAEWFEAHYKREFETQKPPPPSPPRIDDSAMMDQVLPLIPDPATRILDVGCGYGSMLDAFRRRGYTNLFGVEPSDRRAQVARAAGFSISHGTTESMLDDPIITKNAPFDLVVSTHAFEHVFDVQRSLASIARVTRPGGLLCINVPHQEAEHFIQMAHYLPHIHSFSTESLRAAMERNGFDAIYDDSSLRVIGRRRDDKAAHDGGDTNGVQRGRLRLKFIRDFDLRKHPQLDSDDTWLRCTDYRDGREIMEPSYGVFQPIGPRDRVASRLMAKLCSFDAVEHDTVSRFGAWAIQRYQPAVSGAAKCALPSPAALPKLDVVYDADSVFAWYK
jgi:SAM-dependent methyltransferase